MASELTPHPLPTHTHTNTRTPPTSHCLCQIRPWERDASGAKRFHDPVRIRTCGDLVLCCRVDGRVLAFWPRAHACQPLSVARRFRADDRTCVLLAVFAAAVAAGVYRRGMPGSRGGQPVERCDVEARVSRLQQVEGALRELKLQQVQPLPVAVLRVCWRLAGTCIGCCCCLCCCRRAVTSAYGSFFRF